jgi:hypothetical protein
MTRSQNLALKGDEYSKTSGGTGSNLDSKSFKYLSKDTVLELPPPGAKRWSARNKAAVVTAIRAGVLTLEEAYEQYALSAAEYQSWEAGFDTLGLEGLGLAGRQLRRHAQAFAKK